MPGFARYFKDACVLCSDMFRLEAVFEAKAQLFSELWRHSVFTLHDFDGPYDTDHMPCQSFVIQCHSVRHMCHMPSVFEEPSVECLRRQEQTRT